MLSADHLDRVRDAYGLSAQTFQPLGARVGRLREVRKDSKDGDDGDDVVIKVFLPGQEAMARTEAALLAHLNTSKSPDYSVQELLFTVAGETLLPVDGKLLLVTRFQAGAQKRFTEIDNDEWQALGRALAALHTTLDSAQIPSIPSLRDNLVHLDLVHELEQIGRDKTAAQADVDGASFAAFFDDRALLLRERGPRCRATIDDEEIWAPIHNDYNVNNYLFVAGGPPFIIDWDRALCAPREYEVVRCLNHLPLVAPTSASAFLAGYRGLRALRADRMAWAVDAALLSHATKRWPVELWFAGDPGARERLSAMAEMVHVLTTRRRELDAFFQAAAAGAP